MARYAIGDIHGCARTFKKLVEEVIKFTTADTLYLLGDYIDRGPCSKGVLDYLLQIRDLGYNFRPIRGNHEQLLLDALTDTEARQIWYGNGGWATMHEFGSDMPVFEHRYSY
jgi:serine/threonine protein phosphatase 1